MYELDIDNLSKILQSKVQSKINVDLLIQYLNTLALKTI